MQKFMEGIAMYAGRKMQNQKKVFGILSATFFPTLLISTESFLAQ